MAIAVLTYVTSRLVNEVADWEMSPCKPFQDFLPVFVCPPAFFIRYLCVAVTSKVHHIVDIRHNAWLFSSPSTKYERQLIFLELRYTSG